MSQFLTIALGAILTFAKKESADLLPQLEKPLTDALAGAGIGLAFDKIVQEADHLDKATLLNAFQISPDVIASLAVPGCDMNEVKTLCADLAIDMENYFEQLYTTLRTPLAPEAEVAPTSQQS